MARFEYYSETETTVTGADGKVVSKKTTTKPHASAWPTRDESPPLTAVNVLKGLAVLLLLLVAGMAIVAFTLGALALPVLVSMRLLGWL